MEDLERPKSKNSEALAAMAARQVPRYTSYPTAPHFTNKIDGSIYASWLRQIPADTEISFYIHVPYCAAICNYCGCNTKAVRRIEPLNAYRGALCQEIELVGAEANAKRIGRIHWGGGTPSILGPQNLIGIYQELESQFQLDSLKEHAIELDPRVVSPLLAKTLDAMDVTRVNFGVQEFSPAVQEAIGRIQTFEQVKTAVELMREAGVQNIGFDLMYGLPNQTTREVERTLELALSLKPDRLAVFGYAHVPWMKRHQKLIDETHLPGVEERFAQAEVAREIIVAAGYVALGIDHYALPDDELAVTARQGTLHRNFQGYTTDNSPALIAIGASAIGKLPDGFVQNTPVTSEYMRMMKEGSFASVRGIELSADDRRRAGIIESLMCEFVADFSNLEMARREETLLEEFLGYGFIRKDGSRIEVLPGGRPYVRLVASVFDRYYQQDRLRHSGAV